MSTLVVRKLGYIVSSVETQEQTILIHIFHICYLILTIVPA
jgi:hypothetical protein